MDDLVNQLSETLGAGADQIKLILLLVGSVPLALIFPLLPSSADTIVPDLFAGSTGFYFLWSVLDLKSGAVQLLASSVACWAIAVWGGKSKAMPWAIFVVAMGHLAVNHVLRHIEETSNDAIEITGSQMVLCMKLISFGWSVYDGRRPDAELDATQRASKITEVPSIISFLGYTFFFPSILAGPSFTYASYKAFTTKSLFKKEVQAAVSGDAADATIPPGRKMKALKRLATGLVFLGVYSTYGWKFGYGRMLEAPFERNNSLLNRICFMQVAGFVARTKYYGVWCIAESAFILSGLGYNPQTNHYDASRNVRIRSIEFAPNFKILLDSWNMNTNVWLRECIYKRVAKKGRKPGFKSTQITFITSALWHGVNPCYLMTFVLGGFAQALGRSLRKLVRPFFLPPNALNPVIKSAPASGATTPVGTKKTDLSVPSLAPSHPAPQQKLPPPPQTPLKGFYDAVGIVCTQLVLNFAVAPFILLSVHDSLQAWASVRWYGLVMIFVPFLAFQAGAGKHLSRAIKKRDASAEKREGEREERKAREAYEKQEEKKRLARGQGVPALGLDVEHLMAEEERKLKQE